MRKAIAIVLFGLLTWLAGTANAQPAPGYYAATKDSFCYNIAGTCWNFESAGVNGGQEVWMRSTTGTSARPKWVALTAGGVRFYQIATTSSFSTIQHTCTEQHPSIVAVVNVARQVTWSMCGGNANGNIPAGADAGPGSADCLDYSGWYTPIGDGGGTGIVRNIVGRATDFSEWLLVYKTNDVGSHPPVPPLSLVGHCGNGPGTAGNVMWLKIKPAIP